MDWQDKCFSRGDRIAASRQEDAFNDVEFEVKGVIMKANRQILAMASPVLFANFYGPLAVTDGKPVLINDEMGTARGFRAMIDFIYNEENYSITDVLEGKEGITESGELEKLMELLIFGDKYQIKSLINFCRNVLIQKIKFSRQSVAQMQDVICKYDFLTVENQMLNTQIQAFRSAIVDVAIFPSSYTPGRYNDELCKNPPKSTIKFKVNQDVLFHFDAKKQGINYKECCGGESHYVGISWQPKDGHKEIVEDKDFEDNAIITTFHAESNTEITLEFKMADGAEILCFNDLCAGMPFGKYSTEDIEVEIIEINNKSFREAVTSMEPLPFTKFSFQRLGWGA